ncbi:MAG: hypothetical protein KDI88_16925, partial [Gammaproteobacteria bacterium]|nr:hypothetical protein [Gammaproteobacteria bacterium]
MHAGAQDPIGFLAVSGVANMGGEGGLHVNLFGGGSGQWLTMPEFSLLRCTMRRAICSGISRRKRALPGTCSMVQNNDETA